MNNFLGYHSEWNLGSPGGWDYQRMAQELGKFCWQRIKRASGIDVEVDFDHPLLNPVPAFAQLLLRAHKKRFGSQESFVVLVAEEETLPKVGENIHFVDYLNRLPGVSAALAPPHHIESKEGEIILEGKRVSVIFQDFNNDVLVKLSRKYKLKGLFDAIAKGLVVNPRGIEPIGAKGLFEAITGEFSAQMSEVTLRHTPWTRQFYPRSTTGPNGKKIPDLVEWARARWEEVVLKPAHGYSGRGISIGRERHDAEAAIQDALNSGGYIIQSLIPLSFWAEEYPWLDRHKKEVGIKRWQTDFRCFITDVGLIGFVTRFGGVPTNVGSGGGVQSTAILHSRVSVKEATDRINEAIVDLGFDFVCELQDELDKRSIQMGNVYLLGPIMTTLRPRLITPEHLAQLQDYSWHIWRDAIKLEALWRDGRLSRFVEITQEEEQIARMQPWNGSIAIIASDGLFGFGAQPTTKG